MTTTRASEPRPCPAPAGPGHLALAVSAEDQITLSSTTVDSRAATVWIDTFDGHRYAWCTSGNPAAPYNARAFAIAARLGCVELADRIGLRGDVLLVGVDVAGQQTDLPAPVVFAAARLLTPAGVASSSGRSGSALVVSSGTC
jgi:hypothetical protein